MKKLTCSISCVLLALFVLTACAEPANEEGAISADPGAEAEDEPRLPDDPNPASAPEVPKEDRFVVHEWGTCTSMQGSDGLQVEGLHLTEEELPAFVHVRSIGTAAMKSMEEIPEGVTQKLETPVIYFHGSTDRQVSVEVDFPGGVISEWYPSATNYGPAIGELERMGDGMMRWDVDLRPTHGLDAMMPVQPTSVWAPSRIVDANPVWVGDEQEKFIFYRGLGRFQMPVSVQHKGDGLLHVSNSSTEQIPAAFLLKVHEGGGAVVPLGPIPAGDSVTAQPGPKEINLDDYVTDASAQLEGALVETGLYQDEARAMVQTWEQSYFRTSGLRVLYVAPRSWTDDLLPIRITPEPDELVRTLVGRVEVMTREDEATLMGAVEEAALLGDSAELNVHLERYGRFAIPRLERVKMLSDDPMMADYCDSAISTLETEAILDGP